ncbi:MAG: hypothetical protein IJ815_04370 [Lachnospiraceae bacterium]|nr:hypothetical protein [Lachnospiraceae bacterium]
MFCPKCGLEFREGFEECAYCHIPLVEELPENFEENSEDADMSVTASVEMQGIDETEAKEEPEAAAPSKPFMTAAEKANDMKSSGTTLLFVSIVGFVFLILASVGALPIQIGGAGAFITYIVMGGLFLIFFISGVRSLKKVAQLEEDADREAAKAEEISKWFIENHTAYSIDLEIKEAQSEAETGGDEYFERIQIMKKHIQERFMDLDPQFLDFLIDEIYPEVFETEDL